MATKTVDLDKYLDGTHVVVRATVDMDTLEVSFPEEFGDKLSNWVYYDGCRIARWREVLSCEALHEVGLDDDILYCERSEYWGYADSMSYCDDEREYMFSNLLIEFHDRYYYVGDCTECRIRRGDGDIDYMTVPNSWREEAYYCENCDCYIEYEEDYYGDGECIYCHDDRPSIIEGYYESHDHSPKFFGEYKDDEHFVGLGFELEVDCDYDNKENNEDTARGLCSHCGLEEDEMRYAHDGSLNYGFECISQPHTIKDFWSKAEKWQKMLKYLADNGYSSHDAGTCGLHVHVSRGMFGATKDAQDTAIAKTYLFFDENWSEIVKVSRRRSFDYCEKNNLFFDDRDKDLKHKYLAWKKKSKTEGNHGVALNNKNSATFEYRLGRGTLNAWSFFSWIDFVLTITKNARRITVGKLVSNDLLSWLGGIKESTAKYIYKRGAWRKEMIALYPNIEWETDLTDNND